jgi:hypothetical protein
VVNRSPSVYKGTKGNSFFIYEKAPYRLSVGALTQAPFTEGGIFVYIFGKIL